MPTIVDIGGSGGNPKLTLLWENPSPTSNFGAQTVNLSESADNFDAIRIVHTYGKGDAITEGIYSQYDLKDALEEYHINGASDVKPIFSMAYYKTNEVALRIFYFGNATRTSIYFEDAFWKTSKAGSPYDVIPRYIYGVKY